MNTTGYTRQRADQPLGHLFEDPVGDLRDRLPDTSPLYTSARCAEISPGQPLAESDNTMASTPVQAPLSLADRSAARSPVTVAGHLDLDRADLGQHRLGPGAVARVAAVAAFPACLS